MNRLFACLLAFILVPALPLGAQEAAPLTKIKIVTTISPLFDFAREVRGRYSEVVLLFPPGVDPHSLEPTLDDSARQSL